MATLSLAAGAVSSGTAGTGADGSGFSGVLAGGALLVMATFVPFAILRMIPAVEAGAIGHLEALRQRGTSAVARPVRSAAGHVLHEGLGALGDARLMEQTPAALGVGGAARTGAAHAGGSPTPGDGSPTAGGGSPTPGDGAITLGAGDPESPRVFEDGVARGALPAPKGPKPVVLREPAGGPQGGSPAPTGPANPDDAWKWEGVPPGRSLIGKVEPGEMRYYMGDDGHGPSIKWLPPAWPPARQDGDG